MMRLTWNKTGQIAHVSSPSSGIAKKLSLRITLLRRLVGSRWGAGTKTLRIATLSLVYLQLSSAHQFGVAALTLAS